MNARQVKACSVNIIAWGDARGSGLAGWMQNAADPSKLVYTGQGRIRYLPSNASVNSGDTTPSQQIIRNLVLSNSYTGPAPASQDRVGLQRPWGSAANWQQPTPAAIQQNLNSYKWIWSYPNFTGKADNKYASFSVPCGELVEPEPTWVDVPGDHFQCYQIRAEDKVEPTRITTRDQFGKKNIVVADPVMLCNPAEKHHRGKTYKVNDEKRHLVCYNVRADLKPKGVRVETKNQFGSLIMTAGRVRMFCAPSLKEHLKERPHTGGEGNKLINNMLKKRND
jgi:hypothetical protein